MSKVNRWLDGYNVDPFSVASLRDEVDAVDPGPAEPLRDVVDAAGPGPAEPLRDEVDAVDPGPAEPFRDEVDTALGPFRELRERERLEQAQVQGLEQKLEERPPTLRMVRRKREQRKRFLRTADMKREERQEQRVPDIDLDMSRPPSIHRPPGFKLQAFGEFTFSRKTYRNVLEPALEDLQSEHTEALAEDRLWKARWVRIRGTGAFWAAAVAQLPTSLLKWLKAFVT